MFLGLGFCRGDHYLYRLFTEFISPKKLSPITIIICIYLQPILAALFAFFGVYLVSVRCLKNIKEKLS
jgi:hypothetical protein